MSIIPPTRDGRPDARIADPEGAPRLPTDADSWTDVRAEGNAP